jgi:hypothetical protein
MPNPGAVAGQVKGAAIRTFIEWYAERHDRRRLLELVRALPTSQREWFDLGHPALGVLPSMWFPATTIHHVLDGLTGQLSEAQAAELARTAANVTVGAMLTGVQRFLFTRAMTPRTYATVANLAFQANYDVGRVENEILSPKCHRGTVHDWAAHHPFLCRMNVSAKVAFYAHMRCQNARVEERFCRSAGNDACGSIIVWD